MVSIDMGLIYNYENLRIYSDGVRSVHCYTNTAIPDHYEKIKNVIKKSIL